MKTQTVLLLLGGLASLTSGSSECQTIINCKSTSTVTTTITSAVETITVRDTDTVTATTTILNPDPATTCTPCHVESPATTAGTVPVTPATTTAATTPAPLCTTIVQDWNRVSLMWTPEHPKPGPPSPATFASNFDYEAILTLTDDLASLERFEVYQDFQFIGRTSERTAESTMRKDIQDAGEAIRLGFSHGSFTVPAGAHTFTVTWQEAANNPEVHDWSGGALQYRFERVGPCN